MTKPLQSFSADGDDIPLFLARSWAESSASGLRNAREARTRFAALNRAYDRMDGDHLTWADVQSAFSEAWAAECLLIVSASQFELWLTKLYLARGRPAPERLPFLRELRNSVVHLDEATMDEETWTATPGSRLGERNGVGALPGGQLQIWLDDSTNLLNTISADALETHVNSLLNELWRELDDYARDWFEMVRSGR